jgi:hypothetical protein
LGCAVVAVIPFTDEDTEEEEEGVFILARKVLTKLQIKNIEDGKL